MNRQVRRSMAVFLSGALVFSVFSLSFSKTENSEKKTKTPRTSYYFVQLVDKPVSVYNGETKGYKSTAPKNNQKLNMNRLEVKKYATFLSGKRNVYKRWMNQHLNKTKVKVVREYGISFQGLAVQATPEEAKILMKGPGVRKVAKSITYRPLMNRSSEIINAMPLWKAGYDGEGVKVAVIDSGIEQNHPFINDPNLPIPDGFPKMEGENGLNFVNNKVIVAKVFSADPKATPEALGSHGTHVAGTIAGKAGYRDPTGLADSKLTGVAPKAYLGNYNVFPCPDSAETCTAESIQIAAAVEEAVKDGMDIANLSLGGTATGEFDLLEEVINAASKAGMTVVVAAGNEGPDSMTIGSPAIAEQAITVGAVSNSHFFGKSVQVKVDAEERTLPVGSADPGGKLTKRVKAPLVRIAAENELGCQPISEDLKGKVAIIKRGQCTFTDKAKNAQDKGAFGVLIVNNSVGDPTGMQIEKSITIPTLMISDKDGEWLSNGTKASITLKPGKEQEFETENAGVIANFSSRGPTINFTLKPDIAAVGVNVLSSRTGGTLTSFNGTSMAAPHVAGAAALLLQAHPEWKPEDVKAAIVGTGKNPKSAALPLEVGGGILNIGKALNPVAMAFPSNISLGKVEKKGSMSGAKVRIKIRNTSKSTQTYKLTVDNIKNLTLSKTKVTLKRGAEATFEASMNGRFKMAGDYQGYVTVTSSKGKTIRLPYYYTVM